MNYMRDPSIEGGLIQSLRIAISALTVSIHEEWQDAPELSQVAQIMNRSIKVFCTSRNSNIVSNIDRSSVIDTQNQPSLKNHTHIGT